jgi:hypothetical protein
MSSLFENIMQVTASQADFIKLKALFEKGFSLQTIKPIPSGVDNECEWGMDNWGTDQDVCLSRDDEVLPFELEMFFWTNISPPKEALEELSRLFPEISIKLNFYNREYKIAGEYVFVKGICSGAETEDPEEVKKLAKEIHDDDWDEDEE